MIGFIKYVVRLADHTRTIIEHAEQEVQAMNPILTAREGIFQRAFCTYIIFFVARIPFQLPSSTHWHSLPKAGRCSDLELALDDIGGCGWLVSKL